MIPVTPQNAAGWRMEPPVSDPMAYQLERAATAAAAPPEEPPGTRSRSQGLRTGPRKEVSLVDPMAELVHVQLARETAPAPSSRSTKVAS